LEKIVVTLGQIVGGYGVVTLINTVLSCLFFKRAVKNQPANSPKVSVLIPARDEAHNLSKNLPHWTQLKYPDLEILVLNDQSTDGTETVLNQYASQIKILNGEKLPVGWLGKNWACDQLARAASGEILIFVDADVTPEPEAVAYTVATLEKYKLSACSVFLRQNLSTLSAKGVIPWVLQFSLLAWIPHFLAPLKRFSSVVVGNGQWFAMERTVYSQVGGHKAVKNSVIEDMDLSRHLFRAGIAYAPILGPHIAEVTMYRSWSELRAGLDKNLARILGPGLVGNVFFLFLYFGLLLALCFFWGVGSVAVVLALVLVLHRFGAIRCNPLLWIPGLLLAIFLLLESMFLTRMGRTTWKGRGITEL
jgi:glycosyltransferase involved in cell wall biosynthesis